ncbi:capsule biosynthesis GfcC family protein [Vibrio alfacsensis]|uniref:capsule biosynthesis GfcC family protein n=1 Tax=Vibrio alfacsensis TaxID=1074311 RepID=UPI004069690F
MTKSLFSRVILLLPLFLISIQSYASNKLKVLVDNFNLTYNEPTRLQQVLSDSSIYLPKESAPLTIKLYRDDSDYLDKLKEQVITQLDKLKSINDGLGDIKPLITMIEELHYQTRVLNTLDIDLVRLDIKNNPLLEGKFELVAAKRPMKVSVVGLVTEPVDVLHSPFTEVSDYLKQTKISEGGSNSFAWIIFPDGKVKKNGFAYWNNEHTTVPPGSTIFIGFDDDNESLIKLEQAITTLLISKKG